MTCQEVRFIPVRFKDAYGPVGAWFLLFKSRATNAFGGELHGRASRRTREVEAPTVGVKPIPANLRNWLGMLDVMEGKGPIYMQYRAEAIQKIADNASETDPKAYKKKMKELESEAWEDFLDMTDLAGAPLGGDERLPLRRSPPRSPRAEPYFIGSPLRRFGRVGLRSRGSPERRLQGRLLLGLLEHDDRTSGLFCRR